MADDEVELEVADTSDIVDDVVSDVLIVDDQVHVPSSVVEQVESLDFDGESFITDVEGWDDADGQVDLAETGGESAGG